jgi:uncharacterized protein YndB with AHSA1/START domain
MEPILKKVTINAPATKVWKVLTDPAKVEAWMLMETTFLPQKGKDFTFKAEPNENWDGIFKCSVKEIVENKRLVYTWDTGFINAETIVSFELKETGNQTEVTLIHSGWEKMTANQEQTKSSHIEGWDVRFIGKLKELLEKQ